MMGCAKGSVEFRTIDPPASSDKLDPSYMAEEGETYEKWARRQR